MLLPLILAPGPDDGRPQIHFTAPAGWLNDPNGLVYAGGKYHLFYQHNPYGTQWGNMTWGHAISRDLVRWEHLANAIAPDDLGTIFSGSAVVDKADTAGFGKNAIVCFYTAAGGTSDASKGQPFTQCLAHSTDGLTFTKLESNPILGHVAAENRDPKVVWHERSRKWVMALYLDGHEHGFWGSKNLREWRELSRYLLEGSGECPDLFQMPLDGDRNQLRWVFWGADGRYQVGDFDGTRFVPATPVRQAYRGNTAYAAQTYSNAPNGRTIQVSWFRGSEFPGKSWNQQMGFPNELRLRSTAAGPALEFMPVKELDRYRKKVVGHGSVFYVPSGVLDAAFEWDVASGVSCGVVVNGTPVEFDLSKSEVVALGCRAHVDVARGRLKLRVLADRASLEVYAQGGEVYLPFNVQPAAGSERGVRVTGKLLAASVNEVRL